LNSVLKKLQGENSAMIEKMIRENIRKLKPYTAGAMKEEIEEKYNLKNVIKLASNENPYGVSPKVAEEIKKNLRDVHLYPDPSSKKLSEEIAKYLSLKKENIVAGNGSDELIEACAKLFLNAGDAVALIFPSFSYYYILAQIYGVKVKKVALGKNFEFDAEKIIKVAKNAKLIIIASPNNPTGTAISKGNFEEILETCTESAVVLDEAYAEFNDFSLAALVKKYENLIVTRTFSKAFGLAGLRIGYACANKKIAEYLNTVKPPFSTSILAQTAAAAAVKDRGYLLSCIKKIKNERERMLKELGKIEFIEPYPSKANFILFRVLKGNSKEMFEALLRKGVIVRECESFGIMNYIRVTIGTREENNAFLEALRNVHG